VDLPQTAALGSAAHQQAKLYYSRERQPLTDIHNTFRELVFAT
jgi:hypothetical protein